MTGRSISSVIARYGQTIVARPPLGRDRSVSAKRFFAYAAPATATETQFITIADFMDSPFLIRMRKNRNVINVQTLRTNAIGPIVAQPQQMPVNRLKGRFYPLLQLCLPPGRSNAICATSRKPLQIHVNF